MDHQLAIFRQELDIQRAVAALPTSRGIVQDLLVGEGYGRFIARVGLHVATTPWRATQLIMKSALALLRAICQHPLRTLPRTVVILSYSLAFGLISELLVHWWLYLLHGIAGWQVASINRPSLDRGSLVAFPPISKEKGRAFYGFWSFLTFHRPISFFHPAGSCWGMSLYFASLYLHAGKRFQDRKKRLIAAASALEEGAPPAAELLQGVGASRPQPTPLSSCLSAVVKTVQTVVIGARWLRWAALSGIDPSQRAFLACQGLAVRTQESQLAPLVNMGVRGVRSCGMGENGVGLLSGLGDGVYLIRRGVSSSHEMVYVRLSKTLSYTFDPGIGLVAHRGIRQAEFAANTLRISNGYCPVFALRVTRKGVADWGPFALIHRLKASLFA